MSSTRRAEKGAPFRQEKFASSAEYERGLLGNLVARRVEVLGHAADRELIWWIQSASWQPGGLAKLAADLIAAFPERLASAAMQKCGFKPGQVYDAKKVTLVREELAREFYQADFDHETHRQFLLRGEFADSFCDPSEREIQASQARPTSYAASLFVETCRRLAGEELPSLLSELCLDPALEIASCAPRYFPGLVDALRDHLAAIISTSRAARVVTSLGEKVYETLDYCLSGRCMVLIDGLARTGKTFSVQAWCELHPGSVRYVQVPSSNDDIGFFRAIARSLGVSINQNSKAQQLRDRIEDTLLRGNLALVLDEGHYVWPQSNYRDALPGRVNWIMTALVNQGVPVALVTTPQFMRTQKAVERKSCWTSEQFTGRIGHYEKLPDSLTQDDLAAVAKSVLPEGCPKTIETLVAYAQGSAKYLAAIESVARRARFLAGKSHREKVIFADVRSAIKESVIPSDAALAVALQEPQKTRRARAIPAPAGSVHNDGLTPVETPIKTDPRSDRRNDLSADRMTGAVRPVSIAA